MKWIIISLLSLAFTIVDYKIGLEVTRITYGYTVYQLMNSIPFNVIYFCLIFLVELIIMRSLLKIRKIITVLRYRKNNLTT
ncbi:hypothetical protein V6M85_04210 [Sulfolobus tengchongensis]|uniref:Uncharacterized protein n=1 Tax=Sulfolobus tengchongensis TaxID=207809 RepID=A0AAX4L260_9CREN